MILFALCFVQSPSQVCPPLICEFDSFCGVGGQLSNRKKISLGTQPIVLSSFHVKPQEGMAQRHVFFLSWVLPKVLTTQFTRLMNSPEKGPEAKRNTFVFAAGDRPTIIYSSSRG
jgi:hypothetical protein